MKLKIVIFFFTISIISYSQTVPSSASNSLGTYLNNNIGFDGKNKTFIIDSAVSDTWIIDKQVDLNIWTENIKFIFKGNVTVKTSDDFEIGKSMFRLEVAKNTTFIGEGQGATLIMNNDSYNQEYTPINSADEVTTGNKLEAMMCIALYSSENTTIKNLNFKNVLSDPIYIGNIKFQPYNTFSKNIKVDNCRFFNSGRNDISVISVDSLDITDCIFYETGFFNNNTSIKDDFVEGPWAGIDLEPNGEGEILKNVTIKRCEFVDNKGNGITFDLYNNNPQHPNLDSDLEDPTDRVIDNILVSDIYIHNEDKRPLNGGIKFKDGEINYGSNATPIVIDRCIIKNTGHSGLYFDSWEVTPGEVNESVLIKNCVLDTPEINGFNAPIFFTPFSDQRGIIDHGVTEFSTNKGHIKIENCDLLSENPVLFKADIINETLLARPAEDQIFLNDITINSQYLSNSTIPVTDITTGSSGITINIDPIVSRNTVTILGNYNADEQTDIFVKGFSKWRSLYTVNANGKSFETVFSSGLDNIGGVDNEPFFTDPNAKIYPGDYNADGKTDFFVKGYGTYRALYLSKANGTFQRVFMGNIDGVGGTDSEPFFTNSDAKIYVGDYNDDGADDLFVKGYSTWRGLYISDMTGNTFQNKFKRVFPVGDGNVGYLDEIGGTDSDLFFTDPDAEIYVGDYNDDGADDLFVKGYSTWRGLYLSDMDGDTFQNKFKRVFPFGDGNVGYLDGTGGTDSELFFTDPDAEIYVGDYNADGATDLFVKGYSTWRGLYLSDMDGDTFQNKFKRVFPFGDGNIGYLDGTGGTDYELFFTDPDAEIYVGDYNADGADDLFVKGYSTWRGLYLSDMDGDTFQNKFKRVFPFGNGNIGYLDGTGGTDSESFFTDPDAEIYVGKFNDDEADDLFVKGHKSGWRGLYLSEIFNGTFQNKFKRVSPLGALNKGADPFLGGTHKFSWFTFNEVPQNLKAVNSNNKIDLYPTYNLNTNSFDNDIILYPNPTQGIVHIKNKEELKHVLIYNLNGILLLEELNSKKDTINLSELKTGVYFIKILSQGRSYVTKILKK